MESWEQIEIPGVMSPADRRFNDALTRLESFIEKLENAKNRMVCLIRVTNDVDTIGRFSLDPHLDNPVLIENLHAILIRASQCLVRIKDSGHFIALVSSHSLLGFSCELGLACSATILLRREIKIGFPEIAMGMFPAFGIFLSGCLSGRFLRKTFEDRPVCDSSDIAPAFSHFYFAQEFDLASAVRNIIEVINDESGKKQPHKSKEAAFTKTLRAVDSSKLIDEDALWAKFPAQVQGSKNRRPWRMVWDLMRDHRFETDPSFFISATYFLTARGFLSSQYNLGWKRLSLYHQGRAVIPAPEKNLVFIDLEYLVPPARPIARLIREGFAVIFVGSDEKSLKEALDLFIVRLERVFERKEALDLWRRGIAWTIRESIDRSQGYWTQWFPDDHVSIELQGEERRFLRFQSNRDNSDCGWMEHSGDPEVKTHHIARSFQLARLISDGIVVARPVCELQLSSLARSILLQELVVVGSSVKGGITALLQALRDQGWGFIAEENAWEYFMRAREESFLRSADEFFLGRIQLNRTVWQLGIWKEARLYCLGGEHARIPINSSWLSQHMAFFAAFIAEEVKNAGLCAGARDADLFICELFGFPSKLGTPKSFIEEKGELRTYRHWKDFTARYCTMKAISSDIWSDF